MIAEALTDLAITDGAIIATALAATLADRYVIRSGKIERAIRAARTLSGVGEIPASWTRPLQLAREVARAVRGAWAAQHPALPRWARIALVCGFVVPILGPIDEIAGLATLAVLAIRADHRRTILQAWRQAA